MHSAAEHGARWLNTLCRGDVRVGLGRVQLCRGPGMCDPILNSFSCSSCSEDWHEMMQRALGKDG